MRNTSPNGAAAVMAAATESAASSMRWISVLSDSLAEHMAKIHGGDFRIQIDHEDGLIIVARRRVRGFAQPKRGEIV